MVFANEVMYMNNVLWVMLLYEVVTFVTKSFFVLKLFLFLLMVYIYYKALFLLLVQ